MPDRMGLSNESGRHVALVSVPVSQIEYATRMTPL